MNTDHTALNELVQPGHKWLIIACTCSEAPIFFIYEATSDTLSYFIDCGQRIGKDDVMNCSIVVLLVRSN